MHFHNLHTFLPLLLTLAPTLTVSEGIHGRPLAWEKEFCPKKEAAGKPASYCAVQYDIVNKTMNDKVSALTTLPVLHDYPFFLERLPEPLLPIGSVRGGVGDGGMGFSEKGKLETLYSLAINTSVVEALKDQRFKDEEDGVFEEMKVEYWKQLWCDAYSGECDSFNMEIGWQKKWGHKEIEEAFKKRMERDGLIILGNRILDFVGKPENADVKKQCIKSVYHKGEKCNKNGMKCQVGEWDQDVVECQIDCGKQACLRVGSGNNYVG